MRAHVGIGHECDFCGYGAPSKLVLCARRMGPGPLSLAGEGSSGLVWTDKSSLLS